MIYFVTMKEFLLCDDPQIADGNINILFINGNTPSCFVKVTHFPGDENNLFKEYLNLECNKHIFVYTHFEKTYAEDSISAVLVPEKIIFTVLWSHESEYDLILTRMERWYRDYLDYENEKINETKRLNNKKS